MARYAGRLPTLAEAGALRQMPDTVARAGLHRGCVEKQTNLDGGSRGGQNHQSRPRTLVRHASQQPQGRSCGRQPLGLRLQAERGCRCDRRGCSARSLEGFVRCRWVRERRPGALQTVIGMISMRDAPLPEFPSSGRCRIHQLIRHRAGRPLTGRK
jgi:hypothetical protein